MAIKTAGNLLTYLRASANIDKKPAEKTAFHTCDAKVLKALLLETGGEITTTISATVYRYTIVTKHLGVGVYNVWLEKQAKPVVLRQDLERSGEK